jgi:hypothetical protein
MQHRDMAIGQSRTFVEVAAGEFPQPVEMRLDMAEQRIRKMYAQEISEREIRAIEVHARGVRREQSGLTGALCGILLDGFVHFFMLLFVSALSYRLWMM